MSTGRLNMVSNMLVDGPLTCQDKNNESNDRAPLLNLAGIKVVLFLVAPITQVRTKGHDRTVSSKRDAIVF
jgi:hypothetical protein